MLKDRISSSARRKLGLFSLPVSVLLVLCFAVAAQGQCLPNFYASAICGKPAGPDGKIHITVSFNGGSSQQQNLIQRALDGWNAHSDTTGIVFEAASGGATTDLSFSYTENTSLTAGCAHEDPWSGNIWWGMELSNRNLFLGDDEYAAVIMHEIGHFLGLSHTTASTIMRPGQDCSTPAGALNVTDADAQQVANCFSYFCNPPPPPPPPPSGGGGYDQPPCMDHYRINPIYDREGDMVDFEFEYAGCF